jgi:putative exporter of polyketide antibiotics
VSTSLWGKRGRVVRAAAGYRLERGRNVYVSMLDGKTGGGQEEEAMKSIAKLKWSLTRPW